KEEGYDLNDLASKVVLSYLYQVFDDGFYHADPHAGNILIKDGKIVFIDFGAMGKISPGQKQLLVQILTSLISKDIDGLVNVFLQICKQNKTVDKVEMGRASCR